MTQVAGSSVTIELGELGSDGSQAGGGAMRLRVRRQLGAAAAAVLCLLTVAASNPGAPRLGEPLWTGEVSLNGFSLGPDSLFSATTSADRVVSRDLRTGHERWSLGITDLPDRTIDMGGGVTAVTTRALSTDTGPNPGRTRQTIRFVRSSTGEQIFQTVGDLDGRSASGLPVVVFDERSGGGPGCAENGVTCYDMTAWNITTGTVVWRLPVPPDDYATVVFSEKGANGVLQVSDGGLMLRDLATGAVVGQLAVPDLDTTISGQLTLTDGELVLATRQTDRILLSAYRRPSLSPLWSVAVPAPRVLERTQLSGFFFMSPCGGSVCLHIDGRFSQIIDLANGAAGPPMEVEMAYGLGPDMFVATPTPFKPARGGLAVYVIDSASRVVAEHNGYRLVYWAENNHRALLAEIGPNRTRFVVLDEHGVATPIGTVSGAELTCEARADILACSSPGGELRVWRLPV